MARLLLSWSSVFGSFFFRRDGKKWVKRGYIFRRDGKID